MTPEHKQLYMAYIGMASVLCQAKRMIGKLRYSDCEEMITLDDELCGSIDQALADVAEYTGCEARAVDSWSPYIEPKPEAYHAEENR